MIDVPLLNYSQTIDLRVAQEFVVPIAKCSCVVVQTTNRNGVTWSTGVVTVRKSMTGVPGEGVSLDTATTITATGITHLPGGDVESSAFLHFVVTTAESGSGEIQLHFYGTDIAAATAGGHGHSSP